MGCYGVERLKKKRKAERGKPTWKKARQKARMGGQAGRQTENGIIKRRASAGAEREGSRVKGGEGRRPGGAN